MTFGSLLLRTRALAAPLSEVAKLKQKGIRAVLLSALALCVCSLPAPANTIFSNLGSGLNVYNDGSAEDVCGAGAGCVLGTGIDIANEFTVSGMGPEQVTEIDVAVQNASAPDTFDASIWNIKTSVTAPTNQPGTKLAEWDNLTADPLLGCCSLVSIPVSGLTLTGGGQYFLVLTPVGLSDDSFNVWYDNSMGAVGTVLSSLDGSTWSYANSSTINTLSAFAIIGTPEPGTVLLFGIGLIGMVAKPLKHAAAGLRV